MSSSPPAIPLPSFPSVRVRRRVACTFILQKHKKKVTVPGRVGWTLLETAQHHSLPVGGCRAEPNWDPIQGSFGEGPGSLEDHVVLAREFFELVGPPVLDELTLLESDICLGRQPTCARARARGAWGAGRGGGGTHGVSVGGLC